MQGALLLVGAMLAAVSAGENAVQSAAATWNVTDFGVVNDGSADCTAAFQQALDKVHAANGGILIAPTGRYRFDGHLTVPDDVTLRGVYTYAPAHSGLRDAGAPLPVYGTVFEPHADAGNEAGTPFITLMSNAALQGVTIHYPDQDPKADAPKAYPYTVAMRGNNPAITDVQLLNPYNGIDAGQNQRALIRNVHGQPIHIGIFVDQVYDIGRIENVHWNPWWTIDTPIFKWQTQHGTGFLFGRTDWHYVLNTFCFGYDVGYKFMETEKGACNGNFLGIGADDCYTAAVLVEQSAPYGILITNGEFVSFRSEDPTMVRVGENNTGTVRFVNCAFWGPCNRIAVVDGRGTIGFSDCTFVQWSQKQDGLPAIDALGGTVLVRGCEFKEDKLQIRLGHYVEQAMFTENVLAGRKRVDDDARGRTIVEHNLEAPTRDVREENPRLKRPRS